MSNQQTSNSKATGKILIDITSSNYYFTSVKPSDIEIIIERLDDFISFHGIEQCQELLLDTMVLLPATDNYREQEAFTTIGNLLIFRQLHSFFELLKSLRSFETHKA